MAPVPLNKSNQLLFSTLLFKILNMASLTLKVVGLVKELNNWVYFVHSYHAIPDDLKIIAAQVNYGSEKLTAMIENDNLLACQFHPEKSVKTGEKLLRRWLSNIQ